MLSTESLTVADLLTRARGGDEQALNRLFALYRNYMALMARAQVEASLRAKVDPSDLVQQTFLEAYRGFRDFHGSTKEEWLAWLRRILHHNAADFVRTYFQTGKRQVRREVPLPFGGDGEPSDDGESPSQQLLRRERELLLTDAVAQLAPDYQEVILLRNLQCLPFAEVAQRMERSRPAVQMLWMRAIHQLHDLLKHYEL